MNDCLLIVYPDNRQRTRFGLFTVAACFCGRAAFASAMPHGAPTSVPTLRSKLGLKHALYKMPWKCTNVISTLLSYTSVGNIYTSRWYDRRRQSPYLSYSATSTRMVISYELRR